MTGSHGKVIHTINPEGMVKIKGELWSAKSEGEYINENEDIIVTGQDKLKLIVRKHTEVTQ